MRTLLDFVDSLADAWRAGGWRAFLRRLAFGLLVLVIATAVTGCVAWVVVSQGEQNRRLYPPVERGGGVCRSTGSSRADEVAFDACVQARIEADGARAENMVP